MLTCAPLSCGAKCSRIDVEHLYRQLDVIHSFNAPHTWLLHRCFVFHSFSPVKRSYPQCIGIKSNTASKKQINLSPPYLSTVNGVITVPRRGARIKSSTSWNNLIFTSRAILLDVWPTGSFTKNAEERGLSSDLCLPLCLLLCDAGWTSRSRNAQECACFR